MRAERKGAWTDALTEFTAASKASPNDRSILLHREFARSQVVMQITVDAEKQILEGQTDAARATLVAALKLDPSYSVARERLAEISDPGASVASAQAAARPATDAAQSSPALAFGPPKLQTRSGAYSFDVRGTTRAAYEAIARQFGVVAAFDPDLPDRTIRFTAPNVDFPTAMRALGEETDTFFLVRDRLPHQFFVAADTAAKRRDFEPEVEQQIPLPQSETPDEMTETLRVVRDIVGLRRSELNMQTHTLTVRDSLANVALAKALVDEVQQPLGEALLEIEILEVDSTLARNMGITPPTSINLSPVAASALSVLEGAAGTGNLQAVLGTIFGAQNPLLSATVRRAAGAGRLRRPRLDVPGHAAGRIGNATAGAEHGAQRTACAAAGAGWAAGDVLRGRALPHYACVALRKPGNAGNQRRADCLDRRSGFFGLPTHRLRRGPFTPAGVAVGDFNNDGIPDVAVTNQADNTVSILLGNSSGTFGTATTFDTGKGPIALLTGDFTGNGNLDIAVVDNCTVNPGTGCVRGGRLRRFHPDRQRQRHLPGGR